MLVVSAPLPGAIYKSAGKEVQAMHDSYKFIIVGAGLAGASAVQGIRESDPQGTILLLGAENELPYDRPPLSKQLWTGGKTTAEIVLHDEAFYKSNTVDLRLGVEVTQIDPPAHTVRDNQGKTFRYERLLLATSGTPRRLTIPGGDLDGISYYRTFEDYRRLRSRAAVGKSALVIGGGFIGSEIAASLRANELGVTMIFPSDWLVSRVFPEALGRYLTDQYRAKGVEVLTGDVPVSIQRDGSGYATKTRAGREVRTDLIVTGIGITPNIALAQSAGLAAGDGVIVNEFLQTSAPDIYAAGDIALFPETGFGPRRLEHWDNAVNQGKHAGRNMTGAHQPFTYVPFFFSDLFEFGYEAVGDIDSRLTTFADWQEENKTGVIYYLDGDRLRGAMMCNVWGQVDAARALIQAARPVSTESLRGAIH
jgi:3-phenylpropionate/trans-cinnamate dioxygenase ferredoxin reductase subunit